MLVLVLCLLAAPADLQSRLRHLESAGSAEAPASSPDGARVAFVTTLFGTRQVASMTADGGYPNQLTDEPGGVIALRYAPNDPKVIIAIALRGERRRLLFVDEDGTPPVELDPAPGDQYPAGFTRDGKRFFYAVVDGGKVSVRLLPLDTRKPVEVAPPPPAAGPVQAPPASKPIAEALAKFVAMGQPSPDGRSVLAVAGAGLVFIDVATARGEVIVPAESGARFRLPRFSPDGKSIYVLTDAGRKTMGVDAIAVQGRARKTVYAPPQDLEAYAISEDGHRLAVAAEQEGETLFSVLELPSLRPQPLPVPPSGALAPAAAGETPMIWSRAGERLLFGWQLSDDTTDVWAFRLGYGTPLRLTRSPRPGLPRESIPRPALVRGATPDGAEFSGWLWRPAEPAKPRVAIVVSARPLRPVFDKRIAALNFAGLAVLAATRGTQATTLSWLRAAPDLDAREPLVLDFDRIDPDRPDLAALVKRASTAL
jgi:dipeptidyl aminopeptidase/acylaminoacyl peptidase